MKHPSSDTPISRGHDNLFVYSKTKPFDTLDDNEFVVKRLSPEAERLSEKAARLELNKDKTPWYAYLVSIAFMFSIFPLSLLLKWLFPDFWEAWGDLIYEVFLIIFIIFSSMIEARFRPSRRQRVILLSESAAAVRAELGIPEAVREIDVLPYLYMETPKEVVPARKDGRFDNIPVCIWREGDDLCLSDEDTLIRINVRDIGEMREVKRKVHIDAWYKAQAVDAPIYKPYVKQSAWSGINVLSYLEAEIKEVDGNKYLLIPGYDASTFRELADPTRIS